MPRTQEHTTGPWTTEKEPYLNDDPNAPCWHIESGQGYFDDDSHTGFSLCGCVSDADARLIAAAPDMLEALTNLENDDGHIPAPIWSMVTQAISLATKGR